MSTWATVLLTWGGWTIAACGTLYLCYKLPRSKPYWVFRATVVGVYIMIAMVCITFLVSHWNCGPVDVGQVGS